MQTKLWVSTRITVTSSTRIKPTKCRKKWMLSTTSFWTLYRMIDRLANLPMGTSPSCSMNSSVTSVLQVLYNGFITLCVMKNTFIRPIHPTYSSDLFIRPIHPNYSSELFIRTIHPKVSVYHPV